MYKTRHVEISEGRRRRAVSTSLRPLSCLIWEGVLTISPLFESLSLCALFTEWWVFTLVRARLCFLPFYQSPSVPFHSILPRSRHCSVFPFIRNKVSSGRAQCTPVFLGFLYLFLSSSPPSPTRLLRNLCNLSLVHLASTQSRFSLSFSRSRHQFFVFIKRSKMLLGLIECRINLWCQIKFVWFSDYIICIQMYFSDNFLYVFILYYRFYFWNRLYFNRCRLIGKGVYIWSHSVIFLTDT